MKSGFRLLLPAIIIVSFLPRDLAAQNGNDNRTGVAGEFSGSITTAGSYDPYTGNASREIEDLVVAGSVGAYPLKWVRRLNTRAVSKGNVLGGGGQWAHSYQWQLKIYRPTPNATPSPTPGTEWEGPDGFVSYPDGRTADLFEPWLSTCCDAADAGPFGTMDRIVKPAGGEGGNWDLLLADGGVVKFHAPTPTYPTYTATQIIDPYGQVTTLEYEQGRLRKIKEPGGANARFLWITYGNYPHPTGTQTLIQKVEAYDGFGHVTQSVNYTYSALTTNLQFVPPFTYWYLTRADYSDNTYATYSYEDTNMPPHYNGDPNRVLHKMVSECKDLRFAGPMKTIRYDYLRNISNDQNGWGQIRGEKNEMDEVLSWVEYPPPQIPAPDIFWRTEHRRDTKTRKFGYKPLGYLGQYNDFKDANNWSYNNIIHDAVNHTTHCQFTDARGYMTDKTREANFRATIRVTHPLPAGSPASSFVETIYSDPSRPHYVSYVTDERLKTTEFLRNSDHTIQRVNFPNGSGNGPDYPDYPENGFQVFTYNSLRLIEAHLMPNGGTEHFEYDTRGLKRYSWPPATESDQYPDSHKTQYVYYDAINSPGRFDRIDRVWYVVDPLGNKTWCDYNMRGQVTRITYDDGNHNPGPFTENAYNDDGTVAWTKDELGHVTSFGYDAYKRLTTTTQVVNGVSEVTQHDYTPLTGGLGPLSHTTKSVYRVTTPITVTEYDYDANLRRTMKREAPNTPDVATTNYRYDPVGNLEWVQDPRGYETVYEYDERNRQTKITNVALNESTLVTYDAAGNKVMETRLQDNPPSLRSWDYDSMNRLRHVYDWRYNFSPAAFQTTTYGRDSGGNIRTITDTKGAVYEYVYDHLDRKTSVRYPRDASELQRTEEWEYDYAGNLHRYTNANGKHRRYEHDARNRQWHTWWEESGAGQDIVTAFDDASRVESVTTNNGETLVKFGYDSANRKVWEDQQVGNFPAHRVKTDLDRGRRLNLQIIDPPEEGGNLVVSAEMSGTGTYSLSYGYTARNQLKNIYGENHLWAFNYVYDPSGNMISREAVSNGVSSWIKCPNDDYDALNRPKTWEHIGANGFQAMSHYEYDHVNREVVTWREGGAANRGDRFEYAATNQLIGAAYNATNWSSWSVARTSATRTVDYGYPQDKLNRNSVTVNGVTSGYSYSDLNQYTQAGMRSFAYDGNFNLTANASFSWMYDAANHLVSASNTYSIEAPFPTETAFIYDGLGRCAKRTVNGVETIFIYDGWKSIAEWYEKNPDYFEAWNVYGPGEDEILLRQQGKYGYLRYQQDRHGNVVYLLDNDGALIEKYTYDAFGAPTVTGSAGEGRESGYYNQFYLFQGREYFPTLQVYDYRNRFYYPNIGRFLQIDPKGFDAGDMNLFRYVGDDPVDLSDPFGLDADIAMYREDDPYSKTIKNFNRPQSFVYAGHGSQQAETIGQVKDPRFKLNVMGSGPLIPAATVSKSINKHSALSGKHDIFLAVCSAGARGGTLARDVAKTTGKVVIAPNKMFWVNEKGQSFAADPKIDGRGYIVGPDMNRMGSLVRFTPDGKATYVHHYLNEKGKGNDNASKGGGNADSGNASASTAEPQHSANASPDGAPSDSFDSSFQKQPR